MSGAVSSRSGYSEHGSIQDDERTSPRTLPRQYRSKEKSSLIHTSTPGVLSKYHFSIMGDTGAPAVYSSEPSPLPVKRLFQTPASHKASMHAWGTRTTTTTTSKYSATYSTRKSTVSHVVKDLADQLECLTVTPIKKRPVTRGSVPYSGNSEYSFSRVDNKYNFSAKKMTVLLDRLDILGRLWLLFVYVVQRSLDVYYQPNIKVARRLRLERKDMRSVVMSYQVLRQR